VDVNDPFYDPREAVVQKRLQRYDNTARSDHWTGTGYDGSQEYEIELDPWFEESDK
jgi:hypothetical protein